MRKITGHWIQRADFSATDLEDSSEPEVLRQLREHPWAEELRFHDELERSGQDNCPPGLGLNAANHDILHFCPVGPDEWMVHFHFSEPRRILGLFRSTRDRNLTYENVSTLQAEHMISQFFSGERVAPRTD